MNQDNLFKEALKDFTTGFMRGLIYSILGIVLGYFATKNCYDIGKCKVETKVEVTK